MAVTLAQAKMLTQDDIDTFVIDEFAKSSYLLSALPFDQAVNPAGGGATLTYGYTRLDTQRNAAFRAVNSEYTPATVDVSRHTVDLAPLGGSFAIDRVLHGIAAARETALQMGQLIKAAGAFFAQTVVVGDTDVDANSFDGLSVALEGSSTEVTVTTGNTLDLTTVSTLAGALSVIEQLDSLLALMDGPPTALLGNSKLIAKLKRVALLGDFYSKTRDEFGRSIEAYNGIPLVDLGARAGSSDPVIPIAAGLTDLYAVRFGTDGFHGVACNGAPLVRQWLPDFSTAGAVKTGEVELGPVAVALKATKAAAVQRKIKVQ